jgi:hypothetical protein
MENGGVFSCAGVSQPAQPFLAALLRELFPGRPIVVVTEGLKSQESFHQDTATWLRVQSAVHSLPSTVEIHQPSTINSQPTHRLVERNHHR